MLSRDAGARAALRVTAALCCMSFCACLACADILVSNNGHGSSEPRVRRYSEIDGSFLGTSGVGDESLEDCHVGPDGKLYLSTNGLGQGWIKRYDWTTGASLGNLVNPGQNGYQMPQEFIFGADGNVYATSQSFNNGVTGVMKFNGTTGSYQGLFVAPGSGGIGTPARIVTIPGNGDFLVSDGSRINRYNKTTGAFVSTFLANGAGGFTSKGDMLFGPDGNFYVVDQDAANNNGVAKFNGSSGAFLGMLVAPGLVPDTIGGIAFGNDGDLYLSRTLTTTTAGDVRRFDGTTGTFLGVFINDATRLPAPQDILFTPEPASLSIAGYTLVLLVRRKKRSRVRSTPADPAST